MSQYVDRMTQFKNAVANVTSALSGSKCAPFIEFYVGDLRMSTFDKLDYFMQMDMTYAGTGVGSANQFSISIAYVPKPNQDPNLIDKALDGVTAKHLPCRLRYGYSGIKGYNLISQEYECEVLGYTVSLRDSIIYYNITGVSYAMTLREKRYNFPAIPNLNPISFIKVLFNGISASSFVSSMIKPVFDLKVSGDFYGDYKIEIADNASSYAEPMEFNAVQDVTVFQYLDTLLLNIQDTDDPNAIYWYSLSDVRGKKTITIHRTTVQVTSSQYNDFKTLFVFDWGGNHQNNKTNNLVKAFETEFKGELNIATSDEIIETRYGIDSSGNDVQIEGLEELVVGDYMKQDNTVTTRTWAKSLDWAYNASMELEGIPADIPIGAVIEVNPMFYGQKHHTAGLYMITGAKCNITSGGFSTNLNLFKIIVDNRSLTYAKLKSNIVKAISGAIGIIKQGVAKAETEKNRQETTLTFSGKDYAYIPTYDGYKEEKEEDNKIVKSVIDKATKVARIAWQEAINALESGEEDSDVIHPSEEDLKNMKYR